MLPTTLLMFFSRSLYLCYAFVLVSLASGIGEASQLKTFESGSAWMYNLETSVLLNEKENQNNDFGFLVTGNVLVESIWGNSNLNRLLRFELISPKLHVKSKKSTSPDGYKDHASKLETFTNFPFLVLWNKGKIEKVLLEKNEPLSLINFKKGIASLFQFQTKEQEINEVDSSGNCNVNYKSAGHHRIVKTKTSCESSDLPFIGNAESILKTKVESIRKGNYRMSDDDNYIDSVKFEEIHTIFTKTKENLGNRIETLQSLILKEIKTANILNANTFEEAVKQVEKKEKLIFTQESLQTEREDLPSTENVGTFLNAVKSSRSSLKNNLLGTLTSANVITKLISVGRKATYEDITKTLGIKKNQAILHQLFDILGFVQTKASHEAAMTKLNFVDKNQGDLSERYLWSLSMCLHPKYHIISDLLNRFTKSSKFDPKVKETLLLTIASMCHKFSTMPNFHEHTQIYSDVEDAILSGLNHAKGVDKYMYLRALKNLKSTNTIPSLLKIIYKGATKEQVLAWKAIKSFKPAQLNKEVINAALTTFLQLNKKHDSSSRTLALDVILESKPNDKILTKLIYFLRAQCKSPEVQQYLIQKLNMIGDADEDFKLRVAKIIKSDSQLNNYAILADKGLSTALKRNFAQSSSINGSLVAIQEIQSGIVKRGIVNIVLEKNEISQEMFTLGIFSAGLSSFISSDSDAIDSDETATAGIELTVLGTQIRPFVFFDGQGELMGHVWSGTASEMTPAYQALLLLQDYQQFLRLGTGLIAELDLKGAASFDLSGKIETSLWNRNAVSVVEKSAGIIMQGSTKINAGFITLQIEFSMLVEPKFNLETNIDFSSGVSLCMILSQPNFVFNYNILKNGSITGSKHKLQKEKHGKYTLPGKTYSLNRKNNEMCNIIFN